jgi:AcrR family transcriptional regulator
MSVRFACTLGHMPRVSEAHLAARRQQIIDAATRCFLRNGFHATSMQDVIKEADLSVGAFYRYFRSKNELIRAIAEDALDNVTRTLDGVLAAEPVPAATVLLDAVLRLLDDELESAGRPRIAIQVWGESMRDPELGALTADIYGRIRRRFVVLVELQRDRGELPADIDAGAVGAAMFGLVQGYILQRALLGDIDRERYLAGIGALPLVVNQASGARG